MIPCHKDIILMLWFQVEKILIVKFRLNSCTASERHMYKQLMDTMFTWTGSSSSVEFWASHQGKHIIYTAILLDSVNSISRVF